MSFSSDEGAQGAGELQELQIVGTGAPWRPRWGAESILESGGLQIKSPSEALHTQEGKRKGHLKERDIFIQHDFWPLDAHFLSASSLWISWEFHLLRDAPNSWWNTTTPWQQFFHPYSAVWRQRKTRGPQLANIKPPIQAAWISPPETYSRRHVLLAYLWLSLLTYTFSHVTISVTHFNIQKLPGCSCHIARWPPIPGFLGSGHQSRGEGRRKEDCPSPGLDSDPTRQH